MAIIPIGASIDRKTGKITPFYGEVSEEEANAFVRRLIDTGEALRLAREKGPSYLLDVDIRKHNRNRNRE